jgi:hypothetical protein
MRNTFDGCKMGGRVDVASLFVMWSITLVIGLAVAWFLCPAISSGPGRSRAARLRDLTRVQWVAVACGSVFLLISVTPTFDGYGVVPFVDELQMLLSFWTPAVLAVVGAVLVVGRRPALTLMLAALAVASVAGMPFAYRADSFMYRYSLPFHLVWDSVASSAAPALGTLASAIAGAAVFSLWQRRHHALVESVGTIEQAHQPCSRTLH